MNKQCIGCKNIEQGNFPFRSGEEFCGRNGYFIDDEGCCITQSEKDHMLEIFYCPVCGRKLLDNMTTEADNQANTQEG
jgi:hypothetical protein